VALSISRCAEWGASVFTPHATLRTALLIMGRDYLLLRRCSNSAVLCVLCWCMQIPKRGRGAKGGRPVNRDRFISKMFLRGDSVILVLRNPK
jgi:hypothetical protein